MRVKQALLGQDRNGFRSFLDFYSLEDYNDKNAPAVFYGLSHNQDIKRFINHRGFKIYLPTGLGEVRGYVQNILNSVKDLNVIVYDEVWEYLIKSNGIKNYRKVRFMWQDHRKCKLTPLGDKIYIHFSMPNDEEERRHFNKDWFVDVFGDDLIFPQKWIPYNDLIENYFNKSFVHIVTSPLPVRAETTGQAMGLMGRKTFSTWPNLNPSYELYPPADMDTLVKLINIERQKIGTIQSELANQVNDFFDFSDDWLYVDYWK